MQVTSGAAYRAARPELAASDSSAIDQAVDRAAQIEPLLRFPARIGLACIRNGEFSAVLPREADAWIAFAQLHGDYGLLMPISPLVAELAAGVSDDVAKTIINRVRLGAAACRRGAGLHGRQPNERQRFGVVAARLDDHWSIPGAVVRYIQGDAVATALLLDVRNGYPYGTASATASQSGFVQQF